MKDLFDAVTEALQATGGKKNCEEFPMDGPYTPKFCFILCTHVTSFKCITIIFSKLLQNTEKIKMVKFI